MLPTGECFVEAPPEPPKPDPGEGCLTYFQELRCFEPKHPDPFMYNMMFQTTKLNIQDTPHLELMIKEIDTLDLALRNVTSTELQ
jgi:hypothetical protein